MKLEEKTFPKKLKGIAKGLEISGFEIVEYYVRGESGRMIFRSGIRHIMFLGYKSICASFTHKAFPHQKDTRVPSYLIVMMSKMVMQRLL